MAREERGLTVDQVADELMIRRFYLEALEAGSFKDLPERVYATGFVRSYANYMGMDIHATIEQFKRDAYGARNGAAPYRVDLNMPEPVVHSVVPGRSAIISAVVVLVLLAVGIILATQSKKVSGSSIPEPAPAQDMATADLPGMADVTAAPVNGAAEVAAPAVSVPAGDTAAPASASAPANAAAPAAEAPQMEFMGAAPEQKPVAEAVKTEAPVAAAPAETAAAAPQVKNRRVLEALQPVWVEVKNDKGTILFTSILKAGQLLPLPDNSKVTVTTGNAGGLRMIVDGKTQAAFGQPNEVKRNIVLDPAVLDQR